MAEVKQVLQHEFHFGIPSDAPLWARNLADSMSYALRAIALRADMVILEGAAASKPTPDGSKRIYYASDTGVWYYDAGSAWVSLDFLSLGDTPSSYSGQAGKHVRVNSTPDGLEFATPTFLELNDTPSAYTGAAGKIVQVNSTPDGLEFVARQAARMYLSADQGSIVEATWTKIGLNTDSFDTHGITDTTNNRITPTIPGYYLCTGLVSLTLPAQLYDLHVALSKNGSRWTEGVRLDSAKASGTCAASSTDFNYFDGNDYLELEVRHINTGSNATARGGSAYTYLSLAGPIA